MGSLRNPIGPLPSSIYWRRRAVALAVLALLVLLTVWAFSLGGDDGGSKDQGKGKGNGGGPASSITPGPTDPGPAISERPGGREEVGTGGGSGGGPGTGGADAGGADAGGSDAGGAGSGGSGAGAAADPQAPVWTPGPGSGTDAETGTGGGDGAGSGDAGAGAQLPDCGPSAVEVSLNSVKDSYEADEKPKFELTARNTQGSACKIDLGRTASVVTIADAEGDNVWASDDCPREKAPVIAQVPANGESTHTLTWYRTSSTPNCGTPPPGSAKPGTYEVKARLHGLKTVTAKFKLA